MAATCTCASSARSSTARPTSIEIDLLRAGEHAIAVPCAIAVGAAGPFDYLVSVHRFDRFEDFVVYPIRLEDACPEIAFPLLPGDPDVTLDLQAVFDRCYDTGPYRRRVRYGEDAIVPRWTPSAPPGRPGSSAGRPDGPPPTPGSNS